ncbi:hypothetical protein CJU89_6630 [Yarrowia sp. B02]|nr:hypothetical protein CJU89_6630 [Yarrowia sp. B02]
MATPLPDIDSIPPGSTVPLDQLSSMFATLSTNNGLDLGQLSGLLAQESTQGGNSPTSVVVAASPTSEAPAANSPSASGSNNNDGGIGPSQSLVDNGPGFQSSLQALLGTSVTLDVPTQGSNTGSPNPSGSDAGEQSNSPSATITASPSGGDSGSNTGPGFTLPTFPTITLSDSPSAPANTGSSGGGFLGNIFDGIFGTNSIAIPQSWSELFVKTVDWNTLYNGSPGTIDSSGNIIPMPSTTGGAPVVTGSVITLAPSPVATGSSSSAGGILGWIGGLFGGDSSSTAAVATAPVVTNTGVTIVTGTAVVTVTSCSNEPCGAGATSAAPSPSTILPPNNGGAQTTTGPSQANDAGNLKVVVPLLVVPLLALL